MKLLNTAQVAEATDLTPAMVSYLCRNGKVSAEKNGRDWLINESEVERLNNRKGKRSKGGGRKCKSK